MIFLEEKCFKNSGLINSNRTMWYFTGFRPHAGLLRVTVPSSLPPPSSLRGTKQSVPLIRHCRGKRSNPVKCSTSYHITPLFASPARAKMLTSFRRGKPVLRISSLPHLWTRLCTRISSLPRLGTRLRTRIPSLPRLGTRLCTRIPSLPRLGKWLCTYFAISPNREAIFQQKRNFHTTETAFTCQYSHLIQNRDD